MSSLHQDRLLVEGPDPVTGTATTLPTAPGTSRRAVGTPEEKAPSKVPTQRQGKAQHTRTSQPAAPAPAAPRTRASGAKAAAGSTLAARAKAATVKAATAKAATAKAATVKVATARAATAKAASAKAATAARTAAVLAVANHTASVRSARAAAAASAAAGKPATKAPAAAKASAKTPAAKPATAKVAPAAGAKPAVAKAAVAAPKAASAKPATARVAPAAPAKPAVTKAAVAAKPVADAKTTPVAKPAAAPKQAAKPTAETTPVAKPAAAAKPATKAAAGAKPVAKAAAAKVAAAKPAAKAADAAKPAAKAAAAAKPAAKPASATKIAPAKATASSRRAAPSRTADADTVVRVRPTPYKRVPAADAALSGLVPLLDVADLAAPGVTAAEDVVVVRKDVPADPAPTSAPGGRLPLFLRRRTPFTRRRPAVYLAAALVGAISLTPLAPEEPTAQATSTVSQSVSVAEQLGIEANATDVVVDAEATERLSELAASRTARDAEEAAAMQVQAEADRVAAEAAAEAARPKAVMPVNGARLTSGFGARWGTLHAGIDLAAPMHTPEYAVMDGVVLEAGPASGYGLAVYIQHENGDVTVYGHMDEILVEVGQVVRAGDTIALLGNRGQSTGPHLHFEVHVGGLDGQKIDPLPWLRDKGVAI